MGTRQAVLLTLVMAAGGCDHTAPFGVEGPEPLGPMGDTPPIQLTFNLGEDWHPSASEQAIVYSRREAARPDADRCIAVLPTGGGTLTGVSCAGGSYPDSLVDSWIEPVLSPDGRLAYVRDQGRRNAYGPSSRRIVVAPLEYPDSIEFELGRFRLEDGRLVAAVQQLSWSSVGVLRFLVGDEMFEPPVPFAPLDTAFRSYRIVELDIATGMLSELAATEGAFTYTAAPDDGIWMVGNPPDELHHLAPGSDTTVAVGSFSAPAISIASVAGQPVAVVQRSLMGPDGTVTTWTEVEWLDPATGIPGGSLPTPGPAGRISGVPGTNRLVAEIHGVGKTNLWLLEIP